MKRFQIYGQVLVHALAHVGSLVSIFLMAANFQTPFSLPARTAEMIAAVSELCLGSTFS